MADKTYAFKLTVSGGAEFPIDMLRYDSASPASEGDSYLIRSTFSDFSGRVSVNLLAYHRNPHWQPTVGRWDSFTWRVDSWEKIK